MVRNCQIVLTALRDFPLVGDGEDLAAILLDALSAGRIELLGGDVLAVTSKVVSKAEGRFVRLAEVAPSRLAIEVAGTCMKDPRLVQLILEESEEICRVRSGRLIVRHRLGFVCANAGIDRSNVAANDPDDETVLLLPAAPDESAARLRQRIKEATDTWVGIVIVDSHGRPHRLGSVGIAVGVAGLPAVEDWRGRPDLFGRPLQHTTVGLADQIAGAASLLFGEAGEGTPVVLLRGVPFRPREGIASELIRPRELDLYP
jgi:coenzyme F420-0:L-glutamate ligase/coenzyme F420-1:gamma-L-glutamate ligase